jgi:Domain of unknown function (DUF4412)
MRSISFIAAALLATPLAAQQAFEGVVEYDMTTGSNQVVHTIYYQKGMHVRTEMNMGGQTAAMIMDGTTGTMTTIMPSQRMYMTMNLRELAAGMQQQARDTAHPPKITATGRHETIAGHDCEHILMTTEGRNSQMDVCVARGMGYYMSNGLGGARGRRAAEDFWSVYATDPRYAEFRRQFANGFFPLKIEGRDDQGHVSMTMVATKIDRRALSDDLFKPPADYKEMKMPSMPGH